MNFYIIAFDRQSEGRYKEFHENFVNDSRITRWWHYVKSCYLVGTEMTADELSDYYSETARGAGLPSTHLVLEVNLSKRQGLLPKEAWSWFQRNEGA